MTLFQIKILPGTEILKATKLARYECFITYQYNSVNELPFLFDERTETLFISEANPEPEETARILGRIVSRKYNSSRGQDGDYAKIGAMFDQRAFYIASDMFMHYFKKRTPAEKRQIENRLANG